MFSKHQILAGLIVGLLACSVVVQAEEIPGRVDQINDGVLTISSTGNALPQVGDEMEIYVDIPGVGPAQVGTAKVSAVQGDAILAKVLASTGKVVPDQLVTIHSPKSVPRTGQPVPLLIGRTAKDARDVILDAGFQAEFEVGVAAPSGVVPHTVYAQRPESGTRLAKGETIAMTLFAASRSTPDPAPVLGTPTIDSSRRVTRHDIRGRWICTRLQHGPDDLYGMLGVELLVRDGQLNWIGLLPGDIPCRFGTQKLSADYPQFDPATLRAIADRGLDPSRFGAGLQQALIELEGDRLTMAFDDDPAVLPTSVETANWVWTFHAMQPRPGLNEPTPLPPHQVPVLGALVATLRQGNQLDPHSDEVNLKIVAVIGDFPAERAGLRAGDRIVAVQGERATVGRQFIALTHVFRPGDEVELLIERDGQLMPFNVVLRTSQTPEQFVSEIRPLSEQGTSWAQALLGRAYLNGAGVSSNPQLAFDWIQRAAEQGAMEAQELLGRMYMYGVGTETDYKLAAIWLRKAADQNMSDAQVDLGILYSIGDGVDQDEVEAASLFQQAVEQLNRRGQYQLGTACVHGRGVPVDLLKAASLYRKAADQGLFDAFVALARLYESGRISIPSRETGVALYRVGAEADHAESQASLGLAYTYGRGVEVDYKKAHALFEAAAKQDNVLAFTGLGLLAEYGWGVSQDYSDAMRWYRRAADQKSGKAYLRIGLLIYNGKGVKQRYDHAVGWFRAAMNKGEADAEAALGMAYEEGHGVPLDDHLAIQHYEQAYQDGSGWAAYRLGQMYFRGQGVQKALRTDLFRDAALRDVPVGNLMYARALEEEARNGTSQLSDEERRELVIDHYRRALRGGEEAARDDLRRLGVQP